jgi:hypothetical protein
MKAIFLYDYTGVMAQPWVNAGYDCYLFDGQHKEGIHKEGNITKVGMRFDAYNTRKDVQIITNIVGEGVTFVFGFPECTDMAVSGAAHFKKKESVNPAYQAEAVELARLVSYVGNHYQCPWGLENPVSVLSSIWRKPCFYFNPFEFGGYLPENDVHPLYPEYIKPRDAYPKKTGIYTGNGFIEPIRKEVEVSGGYSLQHSKLGGKSLKTKNIRSATPRGFAIAVYEANKGLSPLRINP